MTKPPHYRGHYHVHSRWVREQAYANPNTRCWRCGKTLAEVQATTPHARWEAGHLIDGLPGGPLKAECSPCNHSNGARARAKRRTDLSW